jgi:arylsulfatase A-like enzyme
MALCSLGMALVACAFGCGSPDAPPNIVLIVGDDHGYPDFGFMGSPHVETPSLDRLAAEGTLFPNGYLTASICAPSLNALLTGLDQFQLNLRRYHLGRRGIERELKTELQDFSTLPRLLRAAGYATFQGGKITQKSYAHAGFEEGIPDSAGENSWAGAAVLGRQGIRPVLDFIDRNRDRPFFLWYAPMLPHLPHDAPAEFREPFEGRGFSPAAIAYYANILRFDRSVAELLAHLDASGLRDDTVVVYLADNGWDQGPRASPGSPGLGGPKGKKSLYELGLRTPLVIRWPGRVPAGETREELVSSLDLFPTVLDYAEVPQMPDRSGRSLRPLIEGTQEWSRDYVVGAMPHVRENGMRPARLGGVSLLEPEYAFFVRTPEWHYIWYKDWGADELFDVRRDPSEEHDVARNHPRIVGPFRAAIERWRQEMETRARESFQ